MRQSCPLVLSHELAIVRGAGELHVVCDNDRTWVELACLENALEVGEVGLLRMIHEHEVNRLRREAMLGLEQRDRPSAIT